MSSIVPRIALGAGSAGTSITIGPDVRSTKARKYTVSEFAVRNSDAESMSSGKMRTWLSSTPTSRKPRRIASIEAP